MERRLEAGGEESARLKQDLSPGDVLEVVLEGNPTTGYQWQVKTLDMDVLDWVEGPEYRASIPGRIGGGGVFIFRFKAVRPGKALLRMEYRRPWEEKAPAARTITIRAHVS